MRKIFLNTAKVLLFIVGFTAALWYFLPYSEVGRVLMTIAHSKLSEQGMRLAYSDITDEPDGFTINNLALEGRFNISFSSLTIRPRLLSSLLSLAGVCNIDFRSCNITLGQRLNIGDGHFLMTATPSEVLLEDLRTNGDFRINGYLTVNTSTMKIGQAEARINVPEEFAAGLNLLKSFLPLEQDKNGQWYLRRH